MNDNPWHEMERVLASDDPALTLARLDSIENVPRPPKVAMKDYAGAYAGHPYRREHPSTYRCVVCSETATDWDHCHAHNLIRGPVCRPHNNASTQERWLRARKFPEFFALCTACAAQSGG